uniref:Uncharacterized protein n=1 Tax=viral metagenome TaxID=1070528 RepID=A0A6M3XHR9_9ZZZZ
MITDNYIKMCEQVKEIQKLWRKPFKSYIGDLYWQGKEYLMISEACICVTEIMFEPKDEYIWLPTQEQLQEMMPKSDVTSLVEYIKNAELRYHDRFDENAVGYFTGTFISLTELWLAFVMRECWNKIWTGEKWEEVK